MSATTTTAATTTTTSPQIFVTQPSFCREEEISTSKVDEAGETGAKNRHLDDEEDPNKVRMRLKFFNNALSTC